MLQIENFLKSYHRQTVLQIDRLEVRPGIYWVKGANGSGKSTFLKAVAGLIHFQGNIILNSGIDIKKQPVAYRKQVNFAEAEPIFPEFLTGWEMIRLFADAKNAPKNQEEYFIESMNMQDYLGDSVGSYSSGMLKKLSLVLAFLGRPTLILLDEPLITIDADSLKVLYDWISQANDSHQTSFLLSSHQNFENTLLPNVQEMLVEQQTLKFI
jgi:ABC-2 type transport system ATP-binding protein